LALNAAQVYRSRAGERVAAMGNRRLRRERRSDLGLAPVMLYLGGRYGMFPVEEVLALVRLPVRASLLLAHRPDLPRPRWSPTCPAAPRAHLDIQSPRVYRQARVRAGIVGGGATLPV
jgi:hypothetical protein